MARLSKVSLSYIDIPSNHAISFANNAARDAWFDGRTKQDFNNLYYNREEGIVLQGILDAFRQYNFGYYLNEAGDRIYFRITNLTYVNEQSTIIQIEKDVLLTYLPTATMKPSFIERSNEVPSSIYDGDVPEVNYGGSFSHTLLDTFGTPQAHSFFLQVSGGSAADDVSETTTLFQPKNLDNTNTADILFASMFRVFDLESDTGQCVDFLSGYMSNGTADRIISAGTIPTADIEYSENVVTGHMNAYIASKRFTKNISVSTSLNTRIAKDNVSVIIAEIDNFANQIEIPINELDGGTLTLVYVTDPITQQRHYGVLSGADGNNELKYRITLNVGTSLPSVNLPYYMAVRNIETDLSAQQQNNLIGGASSIVSGAITGGSAGALAGPVGAAVGAVGGAAMAGLSTATSAIQNQVSANAALEKAKRMTPTVSGTVSGFGIFAARAIGVNVFLKEPNGTGLQQLLDYYRFFGYNKSRIITPSVHSGQRFYQGNVNGHFPAASAVDIQNIRALFNSGVWLWPDESSFFNY